LTSSLVMAQQLAQLGDWGGKASPPRELFAHNSTDARRLRAQQDAAINNQLASKPVQSPRRRESTASTWTRPHAQLQRGGIQRKSPWPTLPHSSVPATPRSPKRSGASTFSSSSPSSEAARHLEIAKHVLRSESSAERLRDLSGTTNVERLQTLAASLKLLGPEQADLVGVVSLLLQAAATVATVAAAAAARGEDTRLDAG